MVPRKTAKRWVATSLIGYLVLAGGVLTTGKMYVAHINTQLKENQYAGCERGNVVRASVTKNAVNTGALAQGGLVALSGRDDRATDSVQDSAAIFRAIVEDSKNLAIANMPVDCSVILK